MSVLFPSFPLRRAERHLIVVFLLGILLAPAGLQLRAAETASAPSAHRFLFLLETSSAMGGRSAAVTNLVCEIIRSSFDGKIHPGETFDIWTFNEQAQTNGFSTDTWFPGLTEHYAARAAWFLRGQRFEKKGRLDRAVALLTDLAAQGGDLTVLLLTEGESALAGTPFDAEVSELFRLHRKALKEAGQPFVVVLQIKDRQFAFCSVPPAGSRIEIPERLRAEPKPDNPPATASASPTVPIASQPADNAPETPVQPRAEDASPPVAKPELPDTTFTAPAPQSEPGPAITTTEKPESPKQPPIETPSQPSREPNDQPMIAGPSAPAEAPVTNDPAAPKATEGAAASSATSGSELMEPAAETVASAANASASPLGKWIAVVAVLAFASVAWFWMGRARAPKSSSLISQSLDRNK